MRYTISINEARRVAIFEFSGEMSAKDGKQVFLEYISRPDFDPSFTMITDARQVTAIPSGFLEILSLVRGLRPMLKQFDRGALSIVLVNNDVSYGMARVLEQVLDMFSRIRLRVVETEAEAMDLAGLGVVRLSDIEPSQSESGSRG